MFKSIGEFYGTDLANFPFVTDSGANIKCALKYQEWYPCFDHRLHTAITKSWSEFIENDLEAQVLYKKMLNVRAFFKRSSDKEKMLPKKLPNDSPTRPWCGLSAFFIAFAQSYDKMSTLISSNEMPSNKNLLTTLSIHLQDFTKVFKALECAKMPTIHQVLLKYKDLIKKINEWPQELEILQKSIKKCNYESK